MNIFLWRDHLVFWSAYLFHFNFQIFELVKVRLRFMVRDTLIANSYIPILLGILKTIVLIHFNLQVFAISSMSLVIFIHLSFHLDFCSCFCFHLLILSFSEILLWNILLRTVICYTQIFTCFISIFKYLS